MNILVWLNQTPAVSVPILVALVLVFALMLAAEAGMFRRRTGKDYERKRIYRNTTRGSTVRLSRPLRKGEGYGK